MKKLIHLELNEINITLVQRYIEKGYELSNFQKLFTNGVKTTSSETEYHLQEPWIQWVSVHTGKTYSEHKVFRLGDIVNFEHQQIFEKVEELGYKVGCVSPMNSRNNLNKPAFFIPDPWTKTATDKSWYSKYLWDALEQSVNDNAVGKITLKTYAKLMLSSVYLIRKNFFYSLIQYFLKYRKSKFGKAIFLDILLFEIYLGLMVKTKPDFSTLFLNGGAHIQHHYMYSSKVLKEKPFVNPDWYIHSNLDPLYEVLKVYDRMLGLLLSNTNQSILVSTGLSQIPFSEPVYYYRLREHDSFLKKLGLSFRQIIPRMTRDFLIQFENNLQRDDMQHMLSSLSINGEKIFQEIEIRHKELFVTLTYKKEIFPTDIVNNDDFSISVPFHKEVAFVALKNGHHSGKGYVISNNLELLNKFKSDSHVANLHTLILDFFRRNN